MYGDYATLFFCKKLYQHKVIMVNKICKPNMCTENAIYDKMTCILCENDVNNVEK